MNIVVLDAATLGQDLDLNLFAKYGELTIHQSTSPEEVSEHLKGANVAILNKIKLGAEQLKNADSLKLICISATGFDNVDLDYCRAHGIAVSNVVGYSTQSVAQVTLAMTLSLMTHLPQYCEITRNGTYTANGIANCLTPVYHEIYGKTWGIVGFGNIGKQVGEVAKAMGCRVLVNKRTSVDGWDCVSLEEICREADIISVHTPLNDSTRNLIDDAHIRTMKPTAIFINVARGAVADEGALVSAIEEGRLGGIGIDVYATEPYPADHPYNRIAHLPNVCLTPHMAWGGYETRVRLLNEMAQNIEAFQNGVRRNRVD